MLKNFLLQCIIVISLCHCRATLSASDQNSGVFKLEIKLHVKTPGKAEYIIYQNYTKSARGVRLSILCVATCLANILHSWTPIQANYCLGYLKGLKWFMHSSLWYA